MNKKYNFYNVLFIFILGTLLHFTYNWSNNNFIVGLFSSTNESIFSHTKLLILPTFIFYILFLIAYITRYIPSKRFLV